MNTATQIAALIRIFGVLAPEQIRSDLADLGARELPGNTEIGKAIIAAGGWVAPVTGMLHIDGGHPLRYERLLSLEAHSFAFHRLGAAVWRRQRAGMIRAWMQADEKAARPRARMAA